MNFSHRISVAPMMDYTDRHDRYFLRLISKNVLLYTEMVTSQAIIKGKRDFLLGYDPSEHPIALQLGGSEPRELAKCAQIGEDFGYDEVNLNVGCPSDRVQSGRFGACLMAEPELVAESVAVMRAVVGIPVTVKARIGIDHQDSYEDLINFIRPVADAGCEVFIIHARKAWLQGLSPKQNREIPPLRYDVVYRLKQDFPELTIVINGGVTELAEVDEHLKQVDGVMIGRAAYHDPYLLAEVDRRYYGEQAAIKTRREIIDALTPYVNQQLAAGLPLNRITRHILGLFHGVPGARAWRRHLSEQAHKPGAGIKVIEQALALLEEVESPG